MKSNAITRIVIYSLLIFVLLALLCTVMFRPRWTEGVTSLETMDAPSQWRADQIHSIEVDWAWGDITIRAGETDAILVEESRPSNADPMVAGLKNGKLVLEYWHRKTAVSFGFGVSTPKKDLTITVPQNWTAQELEFNTASGSVNLIGLIANEVNYDGADVEFIIQDCTLGELDIDGASCEVKFTGTLNALDLDGASTDFTGVFTNTPSRMTMDGMSGSLDITLPEDSGFRVNMDGMSCNFSSEFETTSVNGTHTYGNGACLIDVDGMSMDVNVKKAAK